MIYDFDQPVDRRNTDSIKWNYYDDDILPMWVADMDFRSPEPVIRALHDRVEHGIFGYSRPSAELPEIICERMWRLYNWAVTPEQVIFLPGIVSAFNLFCRALGEPGSGVLIQTPVYPPILSAPENQKQIANIAELAVSCNDRTLYYEIDCEVFEAAITPQTRTFLLCNPHNPTGRSYTRQELTRLAEICERYDLIICSDEIHCELMMDDHVHLPIAAISPEISNRCITLMAPSKTFNLPGLGFSFAIVQNPDLHEQFKDAGKGIVPHVKTLATVAAKVAYTEGETWLAALRKYLTANRDYTVDYIQQYLPDIRTTVPEATYLAWLDCRETGIEGNSYKFFKEKARVAFNDGATFGAGGKGFVRLNYGCPRAQLSEALERIRRVLMA